MKQQNIQIAKTARYFVLGEPSEHIESIWFVCHGYGQLANYFIKNFEVLNNGKNLIVAPEGLHRFYWEKFSGRVVASWMTKEDRESDIADYVKFLDAVYDEVLSQFEPEKKMKINVLGFSQGTATVCRWLMQGKAKADNLIICSGAFPDDTNYVTIKPLLDELKTFVIVGDDDEFIKEEELERHKQLLEKNNIRFELIRFEGKHEISQKTLKDLSASL